MEIINAELKLEGAFNNMPGRDAVENLLEVCLPEGSWRYIDTDQSYWQNEKDTLSIEIDGNAIWRFGEKATTNALEGIAKFLHEVDADEFETKIIENKIICRFWWD